MDPKQLLSVVRATACVLVITVVLASGTATGALASSARYSGTTRLATGVAGPLTSVETALWYGVNDDRVRRGLPWLRQDATLQWLARWRASRIVWTGQVTHCALPGDSSDAGCPQGGYAALRLLDPGTSLWFENLYASNDPDPLQAERYLMASAPHRQNILNAGATRIGIATACCVASPSGPEVVVVQEGMGD